MERAVRFNCEAHGGPLAGHGKENFQPAKPRARQRRRSPRAGKFSCPYSRWVYYKARVQRQTRSSYNTGTLQGDEQLKGALLKG